MVRHIYRAVVLTLVAWPGGVRAQQPSMPAYVVVPPGAHDVVSHEENDGRSTCSYTVSAAYPAASVLEAIKSTLAASGWRPLPDDWMNPGLASSHSVGWQYFLDDTVGPTRLVHQWLADWQDETGNLLVYALRYHSSTTPGHDPDNRNLKVVVLYFPKSVAEALRAAVGAK